MCTKNSIKHYGSQIEMSRQNKYAQQQLNTGTTDWEFSSSPADVSVSGAVVLNNPSQMGGNVQNARTMQ